MVVGSGDGVGVVEGDGEGVGDGDVEGVGLCDTKEAGACVVRTVKDTPWACSIVCVSVFLFERIDA